MVCPSMLARELRATSLVSTQWVDRSQHYLFSIVTLYREEHVREWCSRITPDPHGVSRHVRVLDLRISALHRHFVKAALPNLTSFQNLQELVVHHDEPRISCVSLDDLASIFSSFATTLKRLQWTQEPVTSDAWKTLYSLTDILENLVEIDLSSIWSNRCLLRPPALPSIKLLSITNPPTSLLSNTSNSKNSR